MCILLKSPVRSCTVTSVTRPTSLSGVSVGVSPSSCLLNISGARRLYHTFAFHLSLILRRSEEHTSELQSLAYLVCRLLLEKKKNNFLLFLTLTKKQNNIHHT